MSRKRPSLPRFATSPTLSDELIHAVSENDVAKLKSLHKSAQDLCSLDNSGNTLLHLAIRKQALECFIYLLSLDKIPKNAYNSYGHSPLMEAFGYSENSSDYAIELIKSGCDLVPFPDGNTALHLAISNEWIEVAETLIEMGFDVDCQNSEGETPLHVAGKMIAIDEIWMLLFYGANPNQTYSTESKYTNYSSYTLLNFFDIVHHKVTETMMQKVFLNFSAYNKRFSLMNFIECMECECNFKTLLEMTHDINYIYDDLKTFSRRIYSFNPDMFSLFVQEFGFIVEDMFERCCLDELFTCEDPKYLDRFAKNLFTLMTNDIVTTLVNEINSSGLPLLTFLIESFSTSKKLETLTQLLCCLLSYGANMTADAMNAIYFCFGYCDLFKMMLHMDITDIERCVAMKSVIPRIMYDVNLTTKSVVLEDSYDELTRYRLSRYFTLLKRRRKGSVPKLVELARNSARDYIIKRCGIKNSGQFYTVLRKLPIADIYKKLISFERKLYII